MAQRSTATRTGNISPRSGSIGEHMQGLAQRVGDSLRRKPSGRPPVNDPGGSGPGGSPRRGISTVDVRSRLLVVLPRLGVALTALLLIAAAGLMVFRIAFHDRIYPAVIVGDVPVGGMTIDQAQSRLTERAQALDGGTVSFTYGGKTWSPALSEIGVTVDVSSSLDQAQELGRTGDVSDRLAFTGDLIRDNQSVPLKTTMDKNQLNAWFDKVDSDINQRAVDANIIIENGQAKITPDADGVIVDRDAATAQIIQALQSLSPFNVALPTKVESPNIRATDLQPHFDDLEQALQQPIKASFAGTDFTIDPATLTQYLTIETTYVDGAPKVSLSLDTDALSSSLNEEYAAQVNGDPVDATVTWSDGVGLVATSDSVDGVTLKPAEFARNVRDSFLGDDKQFDVPVVVTHPEIDSNNLGALGITNQLATGDSDYSNGTPDRDNNITVGIGLLNGTLVKPGEDFSFNGAIGEITADKGYTEAGVIVAERVGRDIGGGICQVSTTTFRAALLAGFPIGDWWPHAYRLAGYEADGWGPGFDASILQEGSDPQYWGDFTFTNNTTGWLLIQSWTAYPKAYVRIYGTDDGRSVDISDATISDPITDHPDVEVVDDTLPDGTIEQTEWPQDGVDVNFVRTVTDASGEVIDERNFYSPYGGRGNVYTVSPDMEGKSPAAGGGD